MVLIPCGVLVGATKMGIERLESGSGTIIDWHSCRSFQFFVYKAVSDIGMSETIR